ncbi:hypothetical protein C8R43DRAFT_861615, partial [Mycena crocata]
FGELGYHFIFLAMQDLVHAAEFDPDLYAPLSVGQLIQEVLVPEVQVMLIAAEMCESADAALATLYQSTEFG